MGKFYLCSLKYQKMMDNWMDNWMENWMEKKVTEKYLIDALSVTEAEARLIEEMTPYITGKFEVKSVVDTDYTEVLTSNDTRDDKWWKCKVSFVAFDEKSGKEKKTSCSYLVEAEDLKQAVCYLQDGMKGILSDYVIESVSYSKIEEVFFYKKK